MRLYLLLVLSAFSAAGGQMLFRVGAQGRTALVQFINWPLAIGIGLYGLSTLLWIYALSRLPLKNVYPFTALTFVLVYGAAIVVLGERPSWRGFVGITVVLAGLYFIVTDR
jgi:drug/metabolite transporter (DMT)-like permease